MSTIPSTTIITNLKTVTTSTANTLKNGNELKVCLNLLVRSIDAADPNLTTLDDILASLS